MPTGTIRQAASTNNLLVDLREVRARDLRFAEELSLIGGEDSLFTRQLTNTGRTLVWCDEAVVHEWVAATRMQHSWVLRRRFRVGASGVLVQLLLGRHTLQRARVRVEKALAGTWEATTGSANWVIAMMSRSEGRRSRAEGRIAGGLGRLGGAAGLQYHEYDQSGRRRLRRFRHTLSTSTLVAASLPPTTNDYQVSWGRHPSMSTLPPQTVKPRSVADEPRC